MAFVMDLTIEVADCYYRLALSKAMRRNLSGAVRFARGACSLNANHANAARLLKLCLYELGELNVGFAYENESLPVPADQPPIDNKADANQSPTEQIPLKQPPTNGCANTSRKIMEEIRSLVQRKKYRKAARLATTITRRSVRVLNIQGCLYACAKQYDQAASAFAEALGRDCTNQLATKGLLDCIQHEKRFSFF